MSDFSGSAGDDTLTGGVGSDTASGAGGNDSLSGADGADVLVGGAGSDTLDGGPGDDFLYSQDRAPPPFTLPYNGNPYVLPLMDTGSEVDTLRGGDGADRLFAGYGDNVYGGADGSFGDYLFISFQGAPGGVTADFGLASQTIGGGVITGIENISYVQGSQFADNLNARSTGVGYSDFTCVSGMDGNDTLTAGYYTGTLFGDAGDDVVDGRGGAYIQLVDGGVGNDTLYTADNTSKANGGAGADTIYSHGLTHGGAGNDTIVMQGSVYGELVYGDEGDDRITAASSANSIAGGSGADTLIGAEGADALFSADYLLYGHGAADDAGLEHDRLSGGDGADALAIGYGDDADGGAGTDTLRLSMTGAGQGVDLDLSGFAPGASFTLGGGLIQNVESLLYLRGSEFADRLKLFTQDALVTVNAGAGDDIITSQSSSASVLGGAGNDRLVSGAAADTFDGEAGNDTIDYGAYASAVTVDLKTGSGAGGDTLMNVEAAIGSAFNDTLVGRGTGSTLSGGLGNDRLEVASKDVVSLGAGADLVYVSPGSHAASASSAIIAVTDWSVDDRLQFGAATGAYAEATASDFASAVQAAELKEAAGYNFVAVQVGFDVFVFGQPIGQRLHFDDAVRLVGTNLDAVSASNVGLAGALESPLPPPPAPPPPGPPVLEPVLPNAPSAGLGGASGTVTGDMDGAHLTYALDAVITDASSSLVAAKIDDVSLRLRGFGFATDDAGNLAGGTATSIAYSYGAAHGGPFAMNLTVPQTPLTTLAVWLVNDATQTMFASILAGGDRLGGGTGADRLHGFAGADLMYGGGGADALWGGFGNDVIYGQAAPGTSAGVAGATYLRGEEGDDYIIGGQAFDDINGNQGNDTASGGVGDDWVVGGKDNDLLFGDAGGDLVYGNLGNDTCVGGDGADIVRGGQENDVVFGGAGNDYVSGDRGSDTMAGGAGADIFHTFGDAGIDRVTDFSVADGDRVLLDPGTDYTVAQIGADTVIGMVGGGQMTLVGVQMSALPAGWIFGA